MAFDKEGLDYIPDTRGTGGILLYTHETDALATILAADYFNQNEVHAFLAQQNVNPSQGTRIDILGSNGRELDVLRYISPNTAVRGAGFRP